MTDKEKAIGEFAKKGYIILDFISDEYPNFKELMKFSGAGQTLVRNNIKEISSSFEDDGFKIDFLQLPTGEIALYDVEVHHIKPAILYKEIKEEVAAKADYLLSNKM